MCTQPRVEGCSPKPQQAAVHGHHLEQEKHGQISSVPQEHEAPTSSFQTSVHKSSKRIISVVLNKLHRKCVTEATGN